MASTPSTGAPLAGLQRLVPFTLQWDAASKRCEQHLPETALLSDSRSSLMCNKAAAEPETPGSTTKILLFTS